MMRARKGEMEQRGRYPLGKRLLELEEAAGSHCPELGKRHSPPLAPLGHRHRLGFHVAWELVLIRQGHGEFKKRVSVSLCGGFLFHSTQLFPGPFCCSGDSQFKRNPQHRPVVAKASRTP